VGVDHRDVRSVSTVVYLRTTMVDVMATAVWWRRPWTRASVKVDEITRGGRHVHRCVAGINCGSLGINCGECEVHRGLCAETPRLIRASTAVYGRVNHCDHCPRRWSRPMAPRCEAFVARRAVWRHAIDGP